ncbi:unnamed protein product [Owenia fusiformis]|uniref:Uncharacterized protein n=1 Tax=Owenia fusiformis TaxID=6347 RepID=A0A8J1TVH9_OWEFU|nr:unnamed protein product [Owenia fusiformis]
MEKVINEDVPKAFGLFRDLVTNASDLTSNVEALTNKVKEGAISTSQGLSFLEVKYQMLLSYLVNVTHLMVHKCQGGSLEGSQDVHRLVEIRTVLEKMKPIDSKLKYQIDKLIKTANTGTAVNDPLRFRANPDSLVSKLDEEDSDSGSNVDDDEEKKSKVYRPPKLAAVHYDGDQTQQSKLEQHMEKAKKKALHSGVIQELKAQYSEAPEEIAEGGSFRNTAMKRKEQEREEYEERNFVRLGMTKKERTALKQDKTMSHLNDITKFGDVNYEALSGKGGFEDGVPSKRRKSSGSAKKMKGKGKKKGKKRHSMH